MLVLLLVRLDKVLVVGMRQEHVHVAVIGEGDISRTD